MATLSMIRFGLTFSCLLTMIASTVVGAKPVAGTPADVGVINEQQILYWLMKRGEVSELATDAEKQAAVQAFTERARPTPKGGHVEQLYEQQRLQQLKQKKSSRVSALDTPITDAAVEKTVKVLGILIDFPDLPHNNNGLSVGDTGMYYPNYSVEHYRGLLFSETGFTGPQGQNLQSGYQYYQQESGQTFSFTGDVKGWYTAANNGAFYGSNDATNDNDIAVDELVREAVTAAVSEMSNAELATYDVEDPLDLNNNGITDESDGIIDHIMLFHSSVGEEAGGGVLAENAIWSHRSFINQSTRGYTVPGTSLKAYGYTVQPIDAAVGVCVHEFGHDLGLPDEYDLTNSGHGEPVSLWSLMASGTWVGAIAGAQPSGFSPYARSYLQERYKGNWIKERDVALASITNNPTDFSLVAATNHGADTVNQLSLALPPAAVPFKSPYAGQYQYYSEQGHLLQNSVSFELNLPSSSVMQLTMKAHWDIEQDYDFMQVKVNGVAIAGNHTVAAGPYYGATHYISGVSSSIVGAEGPDAWVELVYDLSAYAGQSVTISMVYTTDQSVSGYGVAVDEFSVTGAGSVLFSDGAENSDTVTLAGFLRIDDERPGSDRRYIVQLRNYQGVDAGLDLYRYEPGVLLWLEDSTYDNNDVSEHPGYSFIGVVDADQNLIAATDTEGQIHDAAFSLYDQRTYPNDNALNAISLFDDSNDYSSPDQPQSGMILSTLGLTMEVIAQEADSSTATVRFNRAQDQVLAATIGTDIDELVVNVNANVVGGVPGYIYTWNFGDGSAVTSAVSATHRYAMAGQYTVTLTVTDSDNNSVVVTESIVVAVHPVASFSFDVSNLQLSVVSTATGGSAAITNYLWDFGDGSSATTETHSHSYTQSGDYVVQLSVTNGNGHVATTSQTVTVYLAPQAAFSITPTNLTIQVSNMSVGGSGDLSYLWDFGDGNGSRFAAPNHTYSNAGTYTVVLVITDEQGSTSEESQQVTVTEAVVASSGTSSASSSGGGSVGGGLFGMVLMLLWRRKYH